MTDQDPRFTLSPRARAWRANAPRRTLEVNRPEPAQPTPDRLADRPPDLRPELGDGRG